MKLMHQVKVLLGHGGYNDHIYISPSKYPAALKALYKRTTGKRLDLDNPKSFNEKIQWLKLYGPLKQMGYLADKYLVREYVREKIGEKYLTPLLGVYERPEDIPYSDLPRQFALKATHGCGFNIIVTDKNDLDIEEANERLVKWLNTDFSMYTFEMQYRFCTPRIIAEEYMDNGGGLNDYKFWCFDGKVHMIQFLTDRATCLKMVFYDTDWNRLDYVDDHPAFDGEVDRPPQLKEMIGLAETLSAGYPYARIDFYLLNDGTVRFGEITFTSASGMMKWVPDSMEMEIGTKLDLSKVEKRDEYLLKGNIL